ncbi:MAG: DUF4178 domain-containing protein [Opitutales bacterium]|nr:DUF4178 domain-containing protein [Opitutales bacterium]NRA26026.1 DUF4178 domain-containing protein [Opitutales bacterium]
MSAILLILLIVVALGVMAALWFFSRPKEATGEFNRSKDRPMTIKNVEPGGVLTLKGVGENIEDFEIVITGKHLYQEDGFEWFELEGERGAEKVWIEVEDDDELSVSLTVKKMKLSQIGLNPDEVARIEKADEGEISYEGRSYEFDDWGEAMFYRNGARAQGERFKYWDFESEDGLHSLTIEQWAGARMEAFLSENIRPAQIDIFSLDGKA